MSRQTHQFVESEIWRNPGRLPSLVFIFHFLYQAIVYYIHSLFLHKWGSKYLLQKQRQLISILSSSSIAFFHFDTLLVFKIWEHCSWKLVYQCKMVFKQRKRWRKIWGDIVINLLCFPKHPCLNLAQSLPFFLLVSIVNSTAAIDLHNTPCIRVIRFCIRKRLMERHSRKGTAFLLMISSTPPGFQEK